MRLIFGYKTLDNLPRVKNLDTKFGLSKDVRQKCKIGFIDDNPNSVPIETYRANGFSVALLGNINEVTDHLLSSFADYDVIACDLRGVGMVANPQLEGAHVLSEIRKFYPTKTLIAYTGATHKNIIEHAKRNSDFFIQRAENSDAWINILDSAISKSLNPHDFVRSISIEMLRKGYSIKEILLLEHSIVSCFLSKKKWQRSDLEQSLQSTFLKNNLDKHIVDMVKSFLPSVAVKLIFLGP